MEYVGRDRRDPDTHLYQDDFEELFGVSKDVEGWYAVAKNPFGRTSAEGWGDSIEEALAELLQQL